MLKQRIITSLILTPLVIWGVFSMPALYFSLFILLIVGLSSWEWGHLAGMESSISKGLFTLASLIALALLIWFLDISSQGFYTLLAISILWWLYRIIRVLLYRAPETSITSTQHKGIHAVTAMVSLVALIIPFYSIVYLRNVYHFPGYLFYLLMTIWAADVFAYFSGKYLGKHKLAPHVSPGKTWEGVYGAFAGTAIGALIGAYYFGFDPQTGILFFVLTMIIVSISIFGDLSESLYKRQNALKDSGHLLPGHGGMLDRVDSLVAAAPFYLVGLSILGLLK